MDYIFRVNPSKVGDQQLLDVDVLRLTELSTDGNKGLKLEIVESFTSIRSANRIGQHIMNRVRAEDHG